MSVSNITLGSGVTFGAGVSAGTVAAGTGAITYAQMSPPVIPGQQLEDSSATINGTTGFTINNSGATGVAVPALTAENQTYYTNLGYGNFTATFGPGSTHATATVNISNQYGPNLVFFIDSGISYPATFNYPITIA